MRRLKLHQLPFHLGMPAFGASASTSSCETLRTFYCLLNLSLRILPLTWSSILPLQGGYTGAPIQESPSRGFEFAGLPGSYGRGSP
jgi:hypothetical protein